MDRSTLLALRTQMHSLKIFFSCQTPPVTKIIEKSEYFQSHLQTPHAERAARQEMDYSADKNYGGKCTYYRKKYYMKKYYKKQHHITSPICV